MDIDLCNWNKTSDKNRSYIPVSTDIYYETSGMVELTLSWYILSILLSLELIARECVLLLLWLINTDF